MTRSGRSRSAPMAASLLAASLLMSTTTPATMSLASTPKAMWISPSTRPTSGWMAPFGPLRRRATARWSLAAISPWSAASHAHVLPGLMPTGRRIPPSTPAWAPTTRSIRCWSRAMATSSWGAPLRSSTPRSIMVLRGCCPAAPSTRPSVPAQAPTMSFILFSSPPPSPGYTSGVCSPRLTAHAALAWPGCS